MSVLEELRERRAGVWSDMEELLEEAATEGMDHDQAERHAKLEAEFERLDTDIKARERAERRKRELEEPREVPEGIGQRSPRTQELVAEDREYSRAFNRYMRGGVNQLTGRERDTLEKRAQSVGVPSGGGYLVPDGFRQKLVERLKAFGGIASVAETIETATGNPIEWPTVDDTTNLGEIVDEGGTFSAGADVTFGTATLGAYKYMSGGAGNAPLRVSYELLQDSAFDIEAFLVRTMATRIARIQATHWITGTGVGQPKGLVHGKTGIEIADDTAGVTFADLVTFVHSLDPLYRMNAMWAFNDSSLATLRKLTDENGRPLWLPQQQSGMTDLPGGQLLGYPVVIDQAFADIDVDNNTQNWGAFGDFGQAYVIRRVQEFTLVVDPYGRAANGQVQFTSWSRADGTVQDPNAFIALTGEQ